MRIQFKLTAQVLDPLENSSFKTNVRTPLADFGNAVGPLLGTRLQKDGEGERLVSWKRVTGHDKNGTS
jgi:hypothetical protein